MVYLVLLVWVIYAYLEGKREAIFWHHRLHSTDYNVFKNIDRHPLFVIQRSLVLLLTFGLYLMMSSIWIGLYLVFMNMLIFSFFHNGSMYTERFKMSQMAHPNEPNRWIYPKKWWDQSSSSTAKLTKFMSPVSRTIQMVIGVIGYIVFIWL